MRCPDCARMVSYDTEVDPEESSEPEMEPDGHFTATYRRVLTCADCGTELKDAEIELDAQVDVPEACAEGHQEHEWEVDVSATPAMDVQKTDRHGKPIKNPRYMKTLYGVEVSGTATCEHCKAEVSISLSSYEAASSFNELT